MKLVKALAVSVLVVAALFWAAGLFMTKAGDPHVFSVPSEEQKQAAQAYLDKNLTPLPDEWEWGTFEPDLGITLETGFLTVENAKGTVVVVPGYTAPLELYSIGFKRFQDAGFNVAAISYRGQGRSTRELANPEKGHVVDYALLADDLERFVASVQSRFGGKVFVFGNSKGGHIAMRMAGDFQPDVQAYALMVPMIKIDTGAFPYGFAKIAGWFWSLTGLGDRFSPGGDAWIAEAMLLNEPTACSANPDQANLLDAMYALNEELRVMSPTNQWVRATTQSTDILLDPAYQANIDRPVYMATAGVDTLVSSPVAEQMCAALNQCKARHFEQSRHCINRETDEVRNAIYDDAIALFESLN